MKRRDVLALGLVSFAAGALTPRFAMAQGRYPDRPIKLMVAFSAGGVNDVVARQWAERVKILLGTVYVENQGGGGGTIATGDVARALPDGYTILLGSTSTMVLNPMTMAKVPYEPARDFVPIAILAVSTTSIVVHESVPVKTLKELIAYAKANPGKLLYGSSGAGSPHHLAGELLRQKTGIDIVHVPYRGGGATINDLLGGHIKVAFLSLSTAVPHLTTGKIKLLAVVEKARYQAMPDVPTIGETVPGFEMSSWHGIFAPAATPAPLIARLNAAIRSVLTTEAVKEKLGVLGVAVATSTPEQLADIVKTGLTARGELVKAANIQPE
jgi:tripartite-type tricarboxylate transporter receptor subunit TctC